MKIVAPFYRPLEIFFAFFLIFSDACSSFLRSRLVAASFLFSQEREPNRRQERAQP